MEPNEVVSGETDQAILDTLTSINENLVSQNDLLTNHINSSNELFTNHFNLSHGYYEGITQNILKIGELQQSQLDRTNLIDEHLLSLNDSLNTQFTTLFETLSMPSFTDSTIGMYGLIAIPAVFVIFVLYKLIRMWI